MKNVRDLVNSIIRGSIATKVTAGVVATTIIVGGSVGTYYGVKHLNDIKAEKLEIAKVRESIEEGIKILEDNLAKLPSEEETSNLQEGLKTLKSMDLENEYQEAYELYNELSEELVQITKAYEEDMKKLRDELNSLDTSKFNEEELKSFTDKKNEFSVVVDSNGFTEYKGKFEEAKKLYDELLANANKRLEEEEAKKAEEEAKKEQESNSEQDWTGSDSSESTSNGWVGSTGSTGSSSNSSTGSTGGSTVGSTTGSTDSTNNSGSADNSIQTPSAPSAPAGWKTDIANKIIGSHPNTNNYIYGDSYMIMSEEHYNYLYGIATQFANGAISSSTAISQMRAQSFDFIGIGPKTVSYSRAGKITVAGCDASTVENAVYNQIGFGGNHFVYCTVYFDGVNSTVTYVAADVDF